MVARTVILAVSLALAGFAETALTARSVDRELASAAEQTIEITVDLLPQDDALTGLSRKAVVVLQRLNDPASDASPAKPENRISQEVEGQFLSFVLPVDSVWRLHLDHPDLWTPGAIINASEEHAGKRLPLRVWPASRVLATAGTEEGGRFQPLDELWLRLEPSRFLAKPDDLPPVSIHCSSIEPRRQFECLVPTGEIDLAFRPEGFVPQYYWDLRLKKGVTQDFGRLSFVRGSSVSGWIEGSDGVPLDSERIGLSLQPVVLGKADAKTRARLQRQNFRTHAEGDGFFQFSGIPAGAYRLAASYAGLAPTTSDAIRVQEGTETQLLTPIVLAPALAFEVMIDPPFDLYRKPWSVTLGYFGSELPPGVEEREQRETTDDQGLANFEGLVPGRYTLSVQDTAGNTLYSEVSRLDRSSPTFLPVTIDLIEVEGSVRLGETPLRARLSFAGSGNDAHMTFDSDDEGRFAGYLAGAGPSQVTIISEEPRLERRVVIDVEAADGSAWIDLDLPAGRIFGQTVDEKGNPLAEVRLHAIGGEGSSTAVSDETGDFELPGLPAGSYSLGAQAHLPSGEKATAAMFINLAADATIGPLEFVLEEKQGVFGRVVSDWGPISGAEVMLQSDVLQVPSSDTGLTDASGKFAVELSPRVTQLSGYVAVPGVAFQPVSIVLDRQTPMEFHIHPQSGAIELIFDAHDEMPEYVGLLTEDVSIPVTSLIGWAATAGGEGPLLSFDHLILSAMAPGHYEYCYAKLGPELGSASSVVDWVRTQGHCVAGDLDPGGRLSLRLTGAPNDPQDR